MKKELDENNFIAINYMKNATTIRNNLYKVPLKKQKLQNYKTRKQINK